MKFRLLFILPLLGMTFFMQKAHAQLPNGSVAPDWTLTDLNGNTHTLSDYLNAGKTVVIDFSATWCGPCWSYHNSHALADLYDDHGPNGTDEYMVFFIEGDINTPEDCLYGNGPNCSNSQGNWVANTPYPIINLTSATQDVRTDYSISYWPTIYTICPDGLVYESGQASTAEHYTWLNSCDFDLEFVSAQGMQCYEDQSGSIDIETVAGHGSINYAWSNGASSQDLNNVHPGTYSVVATEGNGISKTLENIVVDGPLSELIAEINNQQDVTCHGAGDGLIDLNINGGTPNYSIAWNSGQDTEDISSLEGGTYSVVVTDDNGCSKDLSIDIIDPDPVEADYTASVENCGRGDATITVSGTGGTGSLTYSNGQSTNTTGQFINLQANDYLITVMDDNNCVWEEMVTVEEIPNPVAEIFEPASFDCETTSITLSANADVGPDFSYLWTTPNGEILSGQFSLTPEIGGPGDYKFVVVNESNGCFAEANVTVEGSTDLPAIVFSDAPTFGCTTSELTIDASGSDNGSDYTFEWTTDDGSIISGADSDMLVVGSVGTYTLTLTNTESGCTTTESIEVAGSQDLPVVAIEEPAAIDCDNQVVVLDGSMSSQGDDYEYSWETADGMIDMEEGSTAEVSAPGTYTLTVLNTASGCESSYTVEVPDESEYVEASWYYRSSGLNLDIDNSTTGNPNSYSWDMGNGDVIDEDIASYTYAKPGFYLVCMTATNGCGDDTYCFTVHVSAGKDKDFPGGIGGIGGTGGLFQENDNARKAARNASTMLFPNPTTGDFTIALEEVSFVESISVVDMSGKVVHTANVNKELTQTTIKPSVDAGNYFVKIQLEDDVIIKNVMIVE